MGSFPDGLDRTPEFDPGFELLPDGTFVSTTYGHWMEEEEPFIVSVRFDLEELDRRILEGEVRTRYGCSPFRP